MSILDNLKAGSARRPLFVGAIVALVILAILVTIYFTTIRSPYRPLFSNVRTAEAAAIVAELEKKKVPYRLKDGGATILVPAKVVDATRLSVLSEDLPLKGMVGFELFNKSDMGLTEFAQQINYHRALQGELARTIMALDSVESARVHLMVAEPTVFRENRRPSKASVTLVARTGREISDHSVRGIQRLVAAAVPDLEATDVVVIDEHGQVISGSAPEPAPSPTDAARETAETYLATEVQAALEADFPGVRATVSIATGRNAGGDGVAEPIEDYLSVWWSGARTFPIQLLLTAPDRMSADAEHKAGALGALALKLDPAFGDSWSVSSGVPETPAPVAERREAAPLPQAAEAPRAREGRGPSPKGFAAMILAVLFLVVIVLTAAMRQRQLPPAPRLSEQQKAVYVSRLRSLLDREDADAARA